MAFLDELPGPKKKLKLQRANRPSGCPIPKMSGISTNQNLREDLKPFLKHFDMFGELKLTILAIFSYVFSISFPDPVER